MAFFTKRTNSTHPSRTDLTFALLPLLVVAGLIGVVFRHPHGTYAQQQVQQLETAPQSDNQLNNPNPTPVTSPLTNQNLTPPVGPLSLSVSPPTAYVHVEPGEKLQHTIQLRNTGTKTLEVTMTVRDFTADGKTGQPVLGQGSIFNRALNPNLNFGEPFLIKPRENRSVTLSMNISPEANQQEYPLAILFQASPAQPQGTTARSLTQVAGTVVSNLILFVSPLSENQGELIIHNLKIPRIIDSFAPLTIQATAKNVGANATPITGTVEINNFLDQTLQEYIFYPDRVLAGYTRQVRGLELEPDIMTADQQIDPEKIDPEQLQAKLSYKSLLFLGPYQVTVQLGNHQRTTTVIALPISFIVLAAVGGLIYWGYVTARDRL